MYISFDYKCRTCHSVEPRLVRREERDAQECECGSKMDKLPPATRTTFRFADSKLKG
jgi:hypothetical protein